MRRFPAHGPRSVQLVCGVKVTTHESDRRPYRSPLRPPPFGLRPPPRKNDWQQPECRSMSGVTASIAAVMRTAHLPSPLESLAPHRPRPCAVWHHQLGNARILQKQRLLRQERVGALREGQATIPCSRQMLMQRRQSLKPNVGTTNDGGWSSWLVLSYYLPYW